MNARRLVPVTCLALGGIIASAALSEPAARERVPPPAPKSPIEQAREMFVALAARAPEHDLLGPLVGTWDVQSKLLLDPANPLVSHGTMTGAWILGKRFVQVSATIGGPGELQSESQTIYGFDSRIRKHTVIGLDTFGTYSVNAAGSYDEKTSTFVLSGTQEDQGQTFAFRWILHFDGPDRFVQEIRLDAGNGQWSTISELSGTRKN